MLRRTLDPEFYTEEVYPGATPYDEKVHLCKYTNFPLKNVLLTRVCFQITA